MKPQFAHLLKPGFLLPVLLLLNFFSFGQGRVVINEYMPWSGCSNNSEYIELMNFGPGPMNIGCYIVTNGQYAVTIPANTILEPGSYYVIAGQNVLSAGCGNVDSSITVDLNWATCNCADKAVPTTGSGFMQDGGSANEKIVLLSPTLGIVDAVSRVVPASSSVLINSSSNAGTCTPTTFDLDNLPIAYEPINISTGINNSYSRRVDGDCGWVKTTDISAGAPNKTGSSSSAMYSFSTLSASECNGTTGSISIAVSAADVSSLFPMTYTLAYDLDSNGVFDGADVYTQGSDSSASSIDISNLAYGRYRITVGSSSGCNLQSYDFFIFNCYGVVLPYRVQSFRHVSTNGKKHWFNTKVTGLRNLKSVVLQAKNAGTYRDIDLVNVPVNSVDTHTFFLSAPLGSDQSYRIKLISNTVDEYYSGELTIRNTAEYALEAWPNPASDELLINLPFADQSAVNFTIMNTGGNVLMRGKVADVDSRPIRISISTLPCGSYVLALQGSMRYHAIPFVKQ